MYRQPGEESGLKFGSFYQEIERKPKEFKNYLKMIMKIYQPLKSIGGISLVLDREHAMMNLKGLVKLCVLIFLNNMTYLSK